MLKGDKNGIWQFFPLKITILPWNIWNIWATFEIMSLYVLWLDCTIYLIIPFFLSFLFLARSRFWRRIYREIAEDIEVWSATKSSTFFKGNHFETLEIFGWNTEVLFSLKHCLQAEFFFNFYCKSSNYISPYAPVELDLGSQILKVFLFYFQIVFKI